MAESLVALTISYNNKGMKFLTFLILGLVYSHAVWGRDISLYRRLTVFPLKVENEFLDLADKSWWEIRRVITADKRFLVATKSFLQKKRCLSSSWGAQPSDAIILGRLLDAHVLVSLELVGREITLRAYEGENGQEVWVGRQSLHPAIPIAEQLEKRSVQLVQDFTASWPYQGFIIEDRFIGEPIYQEGNKNLTKVQVGLDAKVQVGDPVEIVTLTAESLRPLFQGGAKETLVAQGRVLYVDNEVITVQLDRLPYEGDLKEGSLVKFPQEYQRLRDLFSTEKDNLPSVSTSSTQMLKPQQKEIEEKKSLVTSLAFLGSLAVFLILAL
ncbi:MAG: hypothetical protein R2827_04565 [Bdellovibrionales bacterium]